MPSLAPIANRPGLTAIAYRVGTYGVFFQRLLDGIGSVALPDGPAGARPLAALATRSPDDPAVALMDAWAVMADVLTFYQERIANEGYLRTALERRSVLELARAIGYELNPGVAASAYLQFNVEEIIGAAPAGQQQAAAGPGSSPFNSGVVRIAAGTQAQSVPAPGQLPQPFETTADFTARVEWNSLAPRQARRADLALSNGKLYLVGTGTAFSPGTSTLLDAAQVYFLNAPPGEPAPQGQIAAVEVKLVYLSGTTTNLKAGDRLLFVGGQGPLRQGQAFIVRNVVPDSKMNRTRVEFADHPTLPSFAPASFLPEKPQLGRIPFNQSTVRAHILEKSLSEADLQALLKTNGWDGGQLAALVNDRSAVASANGAFALRASAAFFGHNASLWKSLPDPAKSQRSDPYPLDWDSANNGAGRFIWSDSQGNPHHDADAYLERSFPQVVANSWALLEAPGAAPSVFKVKQAADRSLADYGLSGKATGLTLLQQGMAVGLSAPSAVSWAAGRLDAFAIGLDGNLFHKWWDGSWGGPESLGGGRLVNSPSAVSWGAGRLDVFAIALDGNLYHWWWDGHWGGPENRGGGNLVNSPSAVSWASGRLDIFAIGSDGNLYHWWWAGGWGGPENRGGGNLVNSPSAVSWASGRLDIFAIGSDGNLYHWWWAGGWGGPENLGGTNLVNSPSAVSWSANRLDVFANGVNGDLNHKWWDGAQWGGFESLGGGDWVNSPSAMSWGPNRLDVFGVGSDGTLRHKWWDGAHWGGPEALGGGGNLMASPAAVSWSSGRLDIFITASIGHWHHAWWSGAWGYEDLGDGQLVPYPVRTTTAFVQSEQLSFADFPVVDDIPKGTTDLMLGTMVVGLVPGQPVALSGTRADAPGRLANEILTIDEIDHIGGFTSLRFTSGLAYSYRRDSLTISANVALATHGASVSEVLGNGDASQRNQSFTLKRPPLTYVSAPTPTGIASTLAIRVNDIEWSEEPTSYGLGPNDESYVVRLADDGTPTVKFGDPAARLRTGQQNVKAAYRTGIGLAGNVAPGAISILQSRPPGLRGVTNPLGASGGADPQNLAQARDNAPLTVMTLERIVSLADYENFARGFPGIGKAQAIAVWSGDTRLVHITVAAANGDSVDPTSQLYQNLVRAIALAHDPVQAVRVDSYQPLTFNLTSAILIDQPRYDVDEVHAAVNAALTGAMSFARRGFAQAVTAAEIMTLIQAVPGVRATTLSQLYLSSDGGGPQQTEPPGFLPASPARWENGVIQPAQLLLLNPLGANVTDLTQ